MAIRAVVFDIGDVLERNPRTGWQQRWAARLGMAPGEFERRLNPIWEPGRTGASTLQEIELQTSTALGLDPHEVAALMDEVWAEYVGTLNDELARYFAALRPRYKTGIVSNSFVGARERERNAFGFEDMCDTVVYSHEVGHLKPDPRIYEITCDRLGVAPQAAVLLDDVQANVDGARAIGMRAITYVDNAQAIAELRSYLAC